MVDREKVLLMRSKGMSYQRIGAALGINAMTVRSRALAKEPARLRMWRNNYAFVPLP